MLEDHATVLGGGGVAGIAWMTSLPPGLAEAGQDVTGEDLITGTSAGATIAAQVGSGLPLDEPFARQTDPALRCRGDNGRAGPGQGGGRPACPGLPRRAQPGHPFLPPPSG